MVALYVYTHGLLLAIQFVQLGDKALDDFKSLYEDAMEFALPQRNLYGGEYEGRVGGKKKSAVLAKKGSQVKLVRFGDPSLSIKKDQPARKKSYCARSAGQGNTGNIFSANYWSRKAWSC